MNRQQHQRAVNRRADPNAAALREVALPYLPARTYRGYRQPDGTAEVWVEQASSPVAGGAKPRPLALRLNVRSHSPTGFAWGYSGSGPAQLAL